MHTNVISIIILVKTPEFLTSVLKNLNNQKECYMEVLVIMANKHKDIVIISDFAKITVIYKEAKLINPYIIFEIMPIINGEYVAILNSYDICREDRFVSQIKLLNENDDIQIVSCLEKSLNGEESLGNIFVTAEDIDKAIAAYYLPLNLYTFLFRRTFLLYISKLVTILDSCIISEEKEYKEESFILQLLKYTKIEKVADVLYITRYSRKRKKKRKITDYSLNSIDPLYIYNKNKYIERRKCLQSVLATAHINKLINTNFSASKSINILIICANLDIGGTESYLFTLWKALKYFNINIMILCSGGFMAEVFRLKGIMTFIENKLKPYDKCKDYLSVYEIIDKYNIRALLCETDDCIKLSVKISKIAKIPVILQLHGLYYSKSIIEKFNKFFYYLICISDNVKKYYLNFFQKDTIKNKLKVIPNFLDTNYKLNAKKLFLHRKLRLPKDAKILLYTSRLSYSKGTLCENFLNVFFQMTKKDSTLYAVVIGDGEKYSNIKEQANYLNNLLGKEKIFIIGAAYELFNYYSDATLVIGTGRVALEAMFCSTPVLAYGLGGCGGIVNKKNINKMIKSNFYDHSFDDITVKQESRCTLFNILEQFIDSKKNIYKNVQWLQRFIKYLSSDEMAPIIKSLINSVIDSC